MRFEPKHVVTMVVAVAAAVVLAPVGVMAASGTLVNIADPVTGSRRARVGTSNALYTETRPGVPTGAFGSRIGDVTDVVLHVVKVTPAPKRIAVTEWSATVRGDDVTGPNTHVDLVAFTEFGTPGLHSCGHPSGWKKKILRTMALSPGETEQQVFPGPPLLLPSPGSGLRTCLAFHQTRWLGGTKIDLMVSGYTF